MKDYYQGEPLRCGTAAEPPRRPWPDPTPEMLKNPVFLAIWQVIKNWDIGVSDAYTGYTGATGNHVRAIMDALKMYDEPLT
jgi:hypothetical protein